MEDFNSKYTGQQVEDLLDQVASGNAGGGITVETDPVFSASPAASITEEDKEAWNNKVSYSVKDISMVNADGFMTSEGDGFVFPNTPAAQAGQGFVLATLDDIPNALTENDITAMGFTKNTGTYTKPNGGIPKSDLATSVQESLSKADSAVQIEWIGELTAVETRALYDGNMVYAMPSAANGDEDDILLSRDTVKTINGENIVGSGDIIVGKITYFSEEDSLELTPGVVWMRRGSVENTVQITRFASNGKDYEEYAYHFYTGTIADGNAVKLILPDGVKYANKEMFDSLESDTHYELSVVRSAGIVKAVLTAFK